MKKRLLSVVLVAAMVLSSTMSAFAMESSEDENIALSVADEEEIVEAESDAEVIEEADLVVSEPDEILDDEEEASIEDGYENIEDVHCGTAWEFDTSTGVMTITGDMENDFWKEDLYTLGYSEKDVKAAVVKEGVTTLPTNCFSNCVNMASVTLPNSLRKVYAGAFYSCKALQTITIPAGVTNLNMSAFGNNTNLWKIVNNSYQPCYVPGTNDVGGYTVVHWVDANTGKEITTSFTHSTAIRSDKMTVGNVTVTYNSNGGSGSMANTVAKTGTVFKLSPNKFSRKGCTFAGWNTNPNGKGNSFKNGEAVKTQASYQNSSITLYAMWNCNKYTVKFNAMGGKGKMKNQKMSTYKKTKLTKNKFKKSGYTFKGWATSKKNAKKGKVKYKNKAAVQNLTFKNNGKVTLYAVWKKKK